MPEHLLVVLINAVFFFGYAYLTVYVFIPRLIGKEKNWIVCNCFSGEWCGTFCIEISFLGLWILTRQFHLKATINTDSFRLFPLCW